MAGDRADDWPVIVPTGRRESPAGSGRWRIAGRSVRKLSAEHLDPRSVDSLVHEAEPRCRPHVDHAFGHAEMAFEIVHKTDARPAGSVDIVFRGGHDGGPGPGGQQGLQPGKDDGGILRQRERRNVMARRRIASTANAVGEGRTRREGSGHATENSAFAAKATHGQSSGVKVRPGPGTGSSIA